MNKIFYFSVDVPQTVWDFSSDGRICAWNISQFKPYFIFTATSYLPIVHKQLHIKILTVSRKDKMSSGHEAEGLIW